ncbi:polyribonucleotide 5'-hydroxyl-kinase [Nematocida sp. LUAm3]|nr:polyribonucleotide 5'-hydroxyl-kinase [Nematocida sp. LUAm3]KAI5176401.1 polyribonucleotide 5'-hydroxyl-kinase [Nematocida sp. LUAm2]KAI5179310.1 polyribonucleotide 5'-hydroxyl-kinase [Nematocida sp. LUAm1]
MDIQLAAGSELRIEVPRSSKVKLVVSEKTAEGHGQELLMGKWYTVKSDEFFIFTYTGCKIKLVGDEAFHYISEESNIPYVFNMFYALWSLQRKKILIVGAGREVLANIFTNYYIRKSEKVLYIDLDIHLGNIMFPGVLCSTVIQEVFSPLETLFSSEKLAYFYGASSSSKNTDHYMELLEEILEAAKKEGFPGPTIIVGGEETSKEEIQKITSIFPVDQIIVVGNERMLHQIQQENTVYLPSFPGLPQKDQERRREAEAQKIRMYFYGPNDEFSPCTITIKITAERDERDERDEEDMFYKIVQIGDEFIAPISALPLGSSRRKNSTVPVDALPSPGGILAISTAKTLEEVPRAPVLGFLLVLNIISETEIRLLSPQPKCPRYPFLIQGDIRYLE